MAGPCNARRHRPRRCVPPPPPTYPPLIPLQASGTPSTRSPTTRTSSRAPSPPSSQPPAASASSPSSKRGSPSYGASYVPPLLLPFFLLFPPSPRLSLIFPTPHRTVFYFHFYSFSIPMSISISTRGSRLPANSHAPIPGAYLYPARTPTCPLAPTHAGVLYIRWPAHLHTPGIRNLRQTASIPARPDLYRDAHI